MLQSLVTVFGLKLGFIKKVILYVFLFGFVVLQGQDSISIGEMNLRELIQIKVTSAGKKEQFVDEAPANITVVTAQQIQNRGYLTLEEVFKDLPGFDFAVGQPSGEYPTHFLFRGIGDVGQTKVALYVDGILQNDISNGWFRHTGNNFTLSNIERIELVSGPGSALFGSNALAGYVNIITKRNYEISDVNYGLESNSILGLNQTINKDLNGWFKFNNNTSIQLTARYYKSNGDLGSNRYDPGNYFHNNYEPDSVKTIAGELMENEKVNGKSPALKNGFSTSIEDYYIRSKINYKDFDLSFSVWEKKEGLGSYVVGYEYFANDEGKDYLVNHKGGSFEMKYVYHPTKSIKSTTRSYITTQKVLPSTGFVYTYQFQDVNNGTDSIIPNYKKTYESEGYIFGAEEQLDIQTNAFNHFVFGFQIEQKVREFFNVRYRQDGSRSSLSSINKNIELRPVFFSNNAAVFIQDELKLSKRLVLTSGLRLDYDEFYGTILNPRLALVNTNQKGVNYKFMFSQGYKPPTIFELYDEWRGNSSLIPEVIKTCEVEFGYTKNKGRIVTNGFYNNLRNTIQVAPNPDSIAVPIREDGQMASYYQNKGNLEVIGFSIKGELLLGEQLFISGNYQYLNNLSFSGLDNVAKNKLNFVVNYLAFNKVNFNLRGNAVGKIKAPFSNLYYQEKTSSSISNVGYDYVTESNPDGFLEGHLVLNLTITGKNIWSYKNFSIEPYLKINNLLNTNYAYIGRQSGSGVRPVSSIQSTISNPNGFIPAYHPQEGIQALGGIRLLFK